MSFTKNIYNQQSKMPSKIAQKLCRDFVESSFNSSSKDKSKIKSFSNIVRNQKSTDEVRKSFRSITQKITNGEKISNEEKISPTDRSNIRRLKLKGKILNSGIATTGINTLISGPLRCDNNCVTMLQRRDNPPTCKCAQKKKNVKLQEKDVQATVIKICKDKASTNCSRSNICVNEVFENKSYMQTNQSNINIKKKKLNISNKPSRGFDKEKSELSPFLNSSTRDVTSSCNEISINVSEKLQGNHKYFNIRNVGAQRWSISNYPIRGPDF